MDESPEGFLRSSELSSRRQDRWLPTNSTNQQHADWTPQESHPSYALSSEVHAAMHRSLQKKHAGMIL